MKKTFVLCILDGCGIAPKGPYNAFDNAETKTLDYIRDNYPHTILEASGPAVPSGRTYEYRCWKSSISVNRND